MEERDASSGSGSSGNSGSSSGTSSNNSSSSSSSSSSSGSGSSGTLHRWLVANQGLVKALEYLATAGVLFLPSSLEYYEAAAEGCYALSQMIAFVNRVILARTLERCSRLEHVLFVLTRALSHIEVFIEKASGALAGRRGKAQAVFLLESFKSLCRLGILVDRQRPTMLVHWGRASDPDDVRLDISHYEQFYKAAAAAARTPAPATPAPAFAHMLLPDFVGKRSGLVLPPSPDDYARAFSPSPASPQRVASNHDTPPDSLLADMLDMTGGGPRPDETATPGTSTTASASASEPSSEGSDSPPPSPGAATSQPTTPEQPTRGDDDNSSNSRNSSSSSNTSIRSSLPFTAEQALVVGEVLYVLRPAIYAWALNYIATRHRQDSPEAETETEASAGDEESSGDSRGAAGGGGGGWGRARWARRNGGVEHSPSVAATQAFEQAVAVAVSLVVEVSSIQLTTLGLRMVRERAMAAESGGRHAPKRPHKFDAELSRRRLALLYYFIRSPVFDRSTLPLLRVATRLLQHIPLLNSLPQYALNILQYLNQTHFYTSNSS